MRAIGFVLRAGAVVALLAVGFAVLHGDGPVQISTTSADAAADEAAKPARAKRRTAPPPPGRVTIVAVGDIVMGSTPNLPPDGGASFFGDVESELAGDIVLGNLEGTLTTQSGSKCGAGSTNCFAFRTPPSYVRWLKQAGFTVLNLANNHANDFGAAGLRETVRTLDRAKLLHTGAPGEIAYQKVGDLTVATVGFASYPWAQSLTDIPAAARLVRRADENADLVLVTFHGGAEGASRQRVARSTEFFLGENRGNLIPFAHAVVDAGADLVVGHGPHVLRGMEWYRGRLIAYSLGNFAGYKVFALDGPLSVSGILRLTLRGDGRFEGGILVPTQLTGPGLPALDPAERAHGAVRELSRADFGAHGVAVAPTGALGRRS
jgi:hypothetical protein